MTGIPLGVRHCKNRDAMTIGQGKETVALDLLCCAFEFEFLEPCAVIAGPLAVRAKMQIYLLQLLFVV
jgi:hypothetical protein